MKELRSGRRGSARGAAAAAAADENPFVPESTLTFRSSARLAAPSTSRSSAAYGSARGSNTARSTVVSELTEDALSKHIALTEGGTTTSRVEQALSAKPSARGRLTDRTNIVPSNDSAAVAKLAEENRRLQHKLLKQQILLLEEKTKRAQDIMEDRRFARHRLEKVREEATGGKAELPKGPKLGGAEDLAVTLNRETRKNMRNQQQRKKLMVAKPFARNSSIMLLREKELQKALDAYAF